MQDMNRRFRYQFDTYVTNEINPGESRDKTITIQMRDVIDHSRDNSPQMDSKSQAQLSALAQQAKYKQVAALMGNEARYMHR